jgi:predicted HicB family RNase H-like nuclease
MNYKGYAARIEYSEEDGLFVGHIAGIRDIVGFHGESVQELRDAFEEAVTDYLETCAKLGRTPQKPQSAFSAGTPRNCRRKSAVSPQEYQSVGS